MKKILKEEFATADYNEMAKMAQKYGNSELKDLASSLVKLGDEEKHLSTLRGKEINKGLSDREKRHKQEIVVAISKKKQMLARATAIMQELKKGKEEPAKAKERIEKKAGAEPETNLRRTRTYERGHGLRAENYNWKSRVKFYLAGQ
jgi:hypothetical protein